MDLKAQGFELAALTTQEFAALVEGQTVVILLPVGVVEPHGPHLSLLTDCYISGGAALIAAERLEESGLCPLIAPDVAYGVTDCAQAFKGAISVSATTLTQFLREVVHGFLANGVSHVCLINNHLEPAQDEAVRSACDAFERPQVSMACPLRKRWARSLSDEFKRGACHAGEYETAIMLAARPDRVNQSTMAQLPEVEISLSENLRAGISDFIAMGLNQAYAGAPAKATAAHGREMLDLLGRMITTEIAEAMAANSLDTPA